MYTGSRKILLVMQYVGQNCLYGDLILNIPWKSLSAILPRSSFEYIYCGFVEEIQVDEDFVCVM